MRLGSRQAAAGDAHVLRTGARRPSGEPVARALGKRPLLPRGQLLFFLWDARPRSDKAQGELGWEPTLLEDGLAAVVGALVIVRRARTEEFDAVGRLLHETAGGYVRPVRRRARAGAAGCSALAVGARRHASSRRCGLGCRARAASSPARWPRSRWPRR